MTMTNEKKCVGCHKIYPATAEYFNKRKGSKDGLRNTCRACRKIYMEGYNDVPERKLTAKKRKARPEVREQARRAQKLYNRTPGGKAAAARGLKKYKESGKMRDAQLRRNYSITLGDYNELFQQQGGVCAICREKETHKNQYGVMQLSVDHCHETGKIRGLLCNNCNRGIGLLGDDPLRLVKAAGYLGGELCVAQLKKKQ